MNARQAKELTDNTKVEHIYKLVEGRVKEGFYNLEKPIDLNVDQLSILMDKGYKLVKVTVEDKVLYLISWKELNKIY